VRSEELPAFFDALDEWAVARPLPFETIAYGDDPAQVIELRLPPGQGVSLRPLALVLHGGFWRAGFTRRNTAAVAIALAEAGWPSANVEYRREGPGGWRAMLADVREARRSLESFDRAVAIGHSAGGHLALWLAAEGAVDVAVALGGVCDLVAAAQAGLGDDAVQELLGGAPAEVPDAYRIADPAARLPLGAPQRLVHGVDDDRVPIGHALQYAREARLAGDDCRLSELACGHFEPIDPRSAVWPAVLEAIAGASEAAGVGAIV
jgi:acetyl esterase/lipase